MAKHPHRLMLHQKKTWRCTLPGCTYFIHLGLAHTLPGRIALCWECNEEFTLDDDALTDDMPKCVDCRMRARGLTADIPILTPVDESKPFEPSSARLQLIADMNARKKTTVFDISKPKPTASIVAPVGDEIEVEEAHLPECEYFAGGSCTCGMEQ